MPPAASATLTSGNAVKGKQGFQPGLPRPAKAGRKRGVPNKETANIRVMIERALHGAGGIKYLIRQAHHSPAAFLSLVGRILPQNMEVNGTLNASLTVSVEVRQTMALELLDQLFAGRQAALLEHQPQKTLDNAVQSGADAMVEAVAEAVVAHSLSEDGMDDGLAEVENANPLLSNDDTA